MVRWLHLCWSLPLLLVVLALGVVDYLAYTPAGTRAVARALNGQIGPVHLQIRGVRGTLAHAVHVDLLVIDHRRVHIEIENADGRMAIFPLAWRTIVIPRLHAARLLVHVLPKINDGRYWEPHFLPPLTRIDAPDVRVDSFRLQYPSGRTFDTTHADASAILYPKIIRINDGGLDAGLVHVRTSGDILAAQAIGLRGALRFAAHPSGQPAYAASARIDGDTGRLALDALFTEPFGAVFHGQIDDLTSRWHWHGHARVGRLDPMAWHAGHALGILTGELAFDGDTSGFSARGTVNLPGLGSGPLAARFRGDYAASVLTVTSLRLEHPASGAIATATGEVAFVHGGPRLDLKGSWTHFRWPMNAGDAAFHSDRGIYSLQEARPFAYSTTADFQFAGAAPMRVTMRGRLKSDGVTAERAALETLGAQADLSGRLQWEPGDDWELRGRVSGLDVARLRPDVRGSLDFSFEAGGHGYTTRSPFDAAIHDIAGNVRGQRAQGHARIAHRAGDWQFDDVRLQLGSTRLALDGHAGSTLDLNFALDASDLALLEPGAHGQLSARGQVRGDLHDPTLLTTAQARNVEWRGVRLQSLDGHIEFDPHGSGRADSLLQLQGLTLAGRRLDHLSIGSNGTTANHALEIEARAEGYSLSMRGNGHYAAGSWQGEIAAAQVGDGARLHLTLESPAPVLLDGNRMRLEPLCLHDGDARLCVNAHAEDAQRNVEVLASNLPMRALTAGLTLATDYDGSLGVAILASSRGNEPWRGNLKATLVNAAVSKHFPNGRTERLDLGNGTISVLVGEHDLSGEFALDARAAGHISGKFTAHGDDDDWHQWPLSGELSLETAALGYVSAYVGQIDRASGLIRAQLHLSGSAAAPRLDGELRLIDATLDAYQINLSLRGVNLTARLTDDALGVEGTALAGPDGHASVSGKLRWQHGLPYGDLHLTGEDLRVLSIPEARVDASPDVFVRLQGRRIDVRGTVSLPYARIEPANLANAVLSSEDEVMVGEPKTPAAEQYQVFSNLTLTLGERVTVNTHGLSGRLSGSLNVSTDDTGISHGSGELNVEEGKYLAYGRNLDVEHGRLLFSNGLLSDPGLDLRAEKKFPDITAGINVRGTLRNPRLTFFSSPEVPQSQIVSLLLAGGSLQSVTNATDNNEHSTSGRSDALMQGGAILAQQIGGRYNIEAGVEQDMMNETSLVLGRYLSPRLYVSYGVGLAEAINTIKMRYTIGDHWTVKTEAGTQRSADLVFTIEK